MATSQEITVHSLVVKYETLQREMITPVQIGHSFEQDIPEVPHPFVEKYKAVWDTGATVTCITEELAEKLSLVQSGTSFSFGVTGGAECNKFLISLYLPNGLVIPELEVSDCKGNIGCDVLIGMDVIMHGDFAISNFKNKTTFTFRIPSVEEVDYTKQMPRTLLLKSNKTGRNTLCSCGSGKKYKKCCGS